MNAERLYDTVAIVPSEALDGLPAVRLEVRQRRLAKGIIGSITALVAIAIGISPFILYDGEGPFWFLLLAAWWVGGSIGLVAWLLLRHAINAGGPDGWVLREDGTHLLVNLRSHLKSHFDPTTPFIIVLPQRRVRSLCMVRERGVRTHVGDHGVVYENPIRREFLDIVFDGDTEAVAAAIVAERGRRSDGRSRFNHSAARMLPNGTLRIAWRDETNRLRPSLDAVKRRLRTRYGFTKASVSDTQPLETLDRPAQETRLLDMLSRGERTHAIALAKVLYGMESTEAVQFIDTLER
jgi:hypothetical protein